MERKELNNEPEEGPQGLKLGDPPLITVKELADRLKVSAPFVRKKVIEGELRPVRLGQ